MLVLLYHMVFLPFEFLCQGWLAMSVSPHTLSRHLCLLPSVGVRCVSKLGRSLYGRLPVFVTWVCTAALVLCVLGCILDSLVAPPGGRGPPCSATPSREREDSRTPSCPVLSESSTSREMGSHVEANYLIQLVRSERLNTFDVIRASSFQNALRELQGAS